MMNAAEYAIDGPVQYQIKQASRFLKAATICNYMPEAILS
jgi:hypothetical protein